jgi:uncharacterized membrane protein
MSDRSLILEWSEQGAIKDARAALAAAGVLPAARDWRVFLDRLLLWSGAVALAASVIFFIAHNWSDLGKLAKFGFVALLVALAVTGYWRLGSDRLAGKASLLVAAILLGALLALFGQTYQTGADTWELFATWALLIVPWVLIGRFAGMWILWIAIVNVAIALYFVVRPGLFGLVFNIEQQYWTLFAFNTVALVVWELAGRRVTWLTERWAPRLVVLASGVAITLLAIESTFDFHETSMVVWLVYPVWLAGVYFAYRRWIRDLFMLAGGCLSVIVVVTALLTRTVIEGDAAAGGFLVTALAVIGMAAAAGWWLKEVAREEHV